MKKPKKITCVPWGEFICVAKKSKHPKMMKRAHLTGCTKKQALYLLKALIKNFCPNYRILLQWNGKHKGGFSGRWIDIPEITEASWMELSGTKFKSGLPFKKLRIGIVLHEFAHTLDMKGMDKPALEKYLKNKGGHGAKFVRTFDEMLRFYYKNLHGKNIKSHIEGSIVIFDKNVSLEDQVLNFLP